MIDLKWEVPVTEEVAVDAETLAAIDRGIKDAGEGRTVSLDEAEQLIPQWIAKFESQKLCLADFEQILAYSWLEFPGNTERFGNAILNHIGILKNFPYIGAPVSGRPGVRYLVHTPHTYLLPCARACKRCGSSAPMARKEGFGSLAARFTFIIRLCDCSSSHWPPSLLQLPIP